jgi:hypothetical protein
MKWGKYTVITLATFLLFIYGFTLFFNTHSEPKIIAKADQETASANTPNSGNKEDNSATITVTNNIENNIQGDSEVTISNSIENGVNGNTDPVIKNNINNNTDNNKKATIDNEVTNQLNGKGLGTVENMIENNMDGNGKNSVENDVLNNISDDINADVHNSVNTNSNNGSESKDNEDNKEESDKNKDDEESQENADKEDTPELVWGIDSASATTEEFFACVKDNFGEPAIFGRYLGDKEGVSVGLTKEQVDLIHSEEAKVLLIFNHFTDATGHDNGVAEAKEAIKLANDLNVPDGVAIFADIEPGYPVDSAFIEGWYEEISSSNYEPGFYGIFDKDRPLTTAYLSAVENNSSIGEDTYLWTAHPNIGITTKKDAPEFEPVAPEQRIAVGWQYGIDSEACNIDTNLFEGEFLDVLW